jgi:hypothetical protein
VRCFCCTSGTSCSRRWFRTGCRTADFAYQPGVTWQHTRPELTVWQAFVDLEGYRHPNCMNLQLLTDDVREVLDDMADTLLLRLIEDLREKHLGNTGEEDDD